MSVPDVLILPEQYGKKNYSKNLRLIFKLLRDHTPQGGITVPQMATACAISPRNVYRYLRELEALGIGIERPRPSQSAKAGPGLYSLTANQPEDLTPEMLHLAFLSKVQQECVIFQQNLDYVKRIILCILALKNGFKIPPELLI